MPEPVTTAPAVPKAGPSVLSWIAFGVGILGFILGCIPGALIGGFVLLPIAFVLSIVAFFLKGAKWPAATALVLSIVGTIVTVVVFLSVIAGAAAEAFGDAASDEPRSAATESTEEAADGDAAAESDYAVTIDGAAQTQDYEGRPALVVDFTFTNNGDEAANFMFATSPQAFQDGVELESAVIVDDSFDSAAALKDIKPGASVQVQSAYVLDGTSDVTVEVSELISFDDTLLASEVFTVE